MTKKVATGFLVSPCYAVTTAHTYLENAYSPQLAVQYKLKFSVGLDADYAFALGTTATPVAWGIEGFYHTNDWVLVHLSSCLGRRPEIGWLTIADWSSVHKVVPTGFRHLNGGDFDGLLKRRLGELGYNDIVSSSWDGHWTATATKDRSTVRLSADSSGGLIESKFEHSLTDASVVIVAFTPQRDVGDLRISFGKARERPPPFDDATASFSSTPGTSGAPILAEIDGKVQVVGINVGRAHASWGEEDEATPKTFDEAHANYFQSIQNLIHRPDVRRLLDGDLATAPRNPNDARMGNELPPKSNFTVCWKARSKTP